MDPVKQQAVEALRAQLDQIAAYDPDALATGKDLGAINFKSGELMFAQAVELAKEFRALPLDLLPIATLNNLQSPIQSLAGGLRAVASFTLVGQGNPEAQRNSLLQQAQSYYDTAFTSLTPHLAYLSLKSAQVQETMRRSAELLQDTETKVSAALDDMGQKKTELDAIVRAARDAAAKIGVAQFATEFEKIADGHEKSSGHWLIAAIVSALLTAVVAVSFIWLLPPLGELREAPTIQRIITKLIVISVFYVATIWSAQNYRSHRHLAVTNRHRQSALRTFETFVKAAGDDQTKNAVLLEATRCIFSPAASGYLGNDVELPSSRVIEIMKTVASTTPKG